MHTSEALIFLNADGAIQWVNAEAANLLGYTAEELTQRALPPLFGASATQSTAPGPIGEAFQSFHSGEVHQRSGNARFQTKSGSKIAVHWSLSALEGATRGPVVLSLQPVQLDTGRQPAADYREIFEHAVEGIFRTTLDGHYLEVNPALAQMYGYPDPASMMESLYDLNSPLYVEPDRRAEFVRLMREQGALAGLESQVFRADGTTIWVAEFARTIRDEAGRAVWFEGSVIDITARKQAEAAARESEERYRRLVEMANVVPWEAERHSGRFTYVGPQALQFLGHSPEQWMTEGFWQRVVHPDDRSWVEIVRAEALEKGESFECEYRMVRADERPIWVREIVNLLPSNPEVPMMGGFMLDVTYRRETEESLRESRHFVEQLASASPTILYLYDPGRKHCLYVSGRVPDILGFSKDALGEMNPLFLLSLAHPDELDAHREHLDRISHATAETVLEREFRLRNAAGVWLWLSSRECVFKRDHHGRPTHVVGTLENITIQRQSIEELAANEALFRKLAETTRMIPFDFDSAANRFSYVGPQAETLLGYPLVNWYNLGFWLSILHPEDVAEGTLFAAEEGFRPPSDFQTEFRVRAADERLVWLRQIVHSGADEDNRQHVRGFLLDVTHSKMLEDERERSRIQLRELAARNQQVREEERMNIAREIHDELGQALTLFKLDLSLIRTRVTKAVSEDALPPLEEKLEGMEERVDTTLQTVRRILSALRPPLLDEFGLADAIEWHATEFARRISIRCDVKAEPVESIPIATALALFRIFQEITTNIARHARASRMEVDLRMRGPLLVLEVTDNGRGITDQDLAKKGHYGLLGMRERAWAFGGQVWITGTQGKGTAVRVEFPIAVASAVPVAAEEREVFTSLAPRVDAQPTPV